MTMNDSSPPKPKRRRFQFSLRTPLVVLFVVAMILGWGNFRTNRARTNRERVAAVEKAVAEIEQQGGEAFSSWQSATWLGKLFDDPGELECRDLRITDITDAGLEPLKGLTKLEELFLWGTNVTDSGLEHLKGLTNLIHLNLTNTDVTDAGLEHLTRLTNLEYLILDATKVTDAGLEHLQELTNLKILRLRYTKVTDAGVKKLQQALPNCEIAAVIAPQRKDQATRQRHE